MYTICDKGKRRYHCLSFYKKYILLNLGDYEAFEGFNFYVTAFLWCLTVFVFIGVFLSNNQRNKTIRITKQLLRHGARDETTAKTLRELGLDSTYSTKRLLTFGSRLCRTVKRVGERDVTYEEYIAYEKNKRALKKKRAIEKNKHLIVSEMPGTNPISETEAADFSEHPADTPIVYDKTETKDSGVGETVISEVSPFEIDFSDAKFYIPSDKEAEARTILSKRETSVLQNVLTGVFLVSISVCLTFLLPPLLDLLNTLLS